MTLTIDRILMLYETRGTARYGAEAVSQTEHALQCAALAEAAGATEELMTACLLHDLGHLLHGHGEDHLDDGVDDGHQYLAPRSLRSLFSDAVLEPVCLHVDAKRYLCATEPGYWDSLSPASKRSLALQGGTYPAAEAEQFLLQPYAEDAVRLRRWDDLAKVKGKKTPGLDYFAEYLRSSSLLARSPEKILSRLGVAL